MAEASRAESAGRLPEAEDGYDRAATLTGKKRDRDESGWAAAQVAMHRGDFAGALARLDAIAKDGANEHQAEAACRAALLRIAHGDDDEGWRELERVPRSFPESGVAHAAVRKIVEHADSKGAAASAEELSGLRRDLAGTELEPLVAFLSATHVEASGDTVAARDAYLNIAARWPYPHGAFFDDALWHASLLDERLGRFEEAADDLERLVRVRETTFLMGSYERALYVPSMLRLGALYRDRLHDHERARAAFRRLYAQFDRSTKRAEALWLEAALSREDHDAPGACRTLATLVREFPDSRYVPCAIERCPELRRPERSASPPTCHPYIERAGGTDDGAASP
jgi:tetratricopeptide (TPR) repeat protein